MQNYFKLNKFSYMTYEISISVSIATHIIISINLLSNVNNLFFFFLERVEDDLEKNILNCKKKKKKKSVL